MNKSGILDDALGQLGGLAKQTGKAVVKTPAQLGQTAAKQVGIAPETAEAQIGKEATVSQTNQQAMAEVRKKQNSEIVKSMYAESDKKGKENPQQKEVVELVQENPKKTPEEIQKMAKLKQQLHQTTYYQPLVTPPKQPEEKPAEKVEREKMEDLQEKQVKQEEEAKKRPIQQAQNIEKFRGSAG